PDHHRVACKDLRERLGHDGLETSPEDGLRRMLARRPATKVHFTNQNARALVFGAIDWVRLTPARQLGAVILEQMFIEPLEGNCLEVACGNDAVSVDVVAAHGDGPAG